MSSPAVPIKVSSFAVPIKLSACKPPRNVTPSAPVKPAASIVTDTLWSSAATIIPSETLKTLAVFVPSLRDASVPAVLLKVIEPLAAP